MPLDTFDTSEMRSIRDFVRLAASRFQEHGLFFGHGTDNAVDEALYMVLSALHLPHEQVDAWLDARLTKSEREHLAHLLAQRIETRKPAAYLLNQAWFADLAFYVDERVLVPRSPLAELIEREFAPWVEPDRVRKVLDLCTGSGCVAIACAFAFPEARIDAVDISADALEVAARNVDEYDLAEQVRLVRSDLFNSLQPLRYDLIVTNPPYVSREQIESMPEEFQHEPLLGLESGEDGMDIVLRILARAEKHLAAGGVLVGEVGINQQVLEDAVPGLPLTWVDLESGGEGVFVVAAETLAANREAIERALAQRGLESAS